MTRQRLVLILATVGLVAWWPGCTTETLPVVNTHRAPDAPGVAATVPSPPIPPLPPVPTPQQMAWHAMERILFVHFGMNTLTGREWGTGRENPSGFSPSDLQPRQWAQVAAAAGFQGLILTAKHIDGFCLWPSRVTDHTVARSPWQNGTGDLVRDVARACREAGLAFGIYLAPWDRHEPTWGTPAYDAYYVAQLTELLTGYGPIFEVWIDGGHGPDVEIPAYDYARYWDTIRRLQPDALIAIQGPDVRWIGNEDGRGQPTEWSAVGDRWHPAECDVSLRPGWFWRRSENRKVKSVRRLIDLYFASVGRNCTLLLNVPPDAQGMIPARDAQTLQAFGAALDRIFSQNRAAGRPVTASNVRQDHPGWRPEQATDGRADTFWTTDDGVTDGWLVVDLGRTRFNVLELQEAVAYGQRVEAYRLDVWNGEGWTTVHRGTTIGYKKLDRIPLTVARKVRLVIERARANPALQQFGLYLD